MSLSTPSHPGNTIVFPFPCPKGCGRFTSHPEVVCCAPCVLPTGEHGHSDWCDSVQTTDTLTEHALDMLLFSWRQYITLEVDV